MCVSLWLIVSISGLNAATCSYSTDPAVFYSCELSNAEMMIPNGNIFIDGEHVSEKNDIDVLLLRIQSSSSEIISVPADIFIKFINLVFLELNSVKIKTLSRSSFFNCDHLSLLYLERNIISLIPDKVFERCNNLFHISLKSNSIAIIESDAFSGLSHLSSLDISDNQITQLNFNIASNQLSYLDFSNNKVSEVRPDFHIGLEKIKYLFINGDSNVCINGSYYEEFPTIKNVAPMFEKCYQNYRDLPKEKTVSCKYYLNKDYGYTCEISNVDSMLITDTFIITGTHLVGKTDENVTLVLIQKSNFLRIPNETFLKFPALAYFSMSNAGVTTLDENSFKNATNLKIVWLNKNKITELSAFVFKEAPKLEQLMLSQNLISEINVDAFNGTSRLLRLDMSNNKLENLTSGSFQSLTNLQILMLANNEVKSIDLDAFEGLTNLRNLNLDGSKLVDVTEEWFTTTTKLQTLSLQRNQIDTIGKNALLKLRFLKELKLENNICVSKNFVNINNADVDVIPYISKCVTNFNMVYKVKECIFVNITYNFLGYNCNISDITYLTTNDVFNIGGTHLSGKIDDDVKSVTVTKSQLFRVPKIFFDKFKNLEILDVSKVGMKIIDGNTFQPCGKLQYLYARENGITTLTADAFGSCLELHSVYLQSNKIDAVEATTKFLEKQTKLVYVELKYNDCINRDFGGYYNPNGLLSIRSDLEVCHKNFDLSVHA